ncbi:MAG TPA: ABC transporter permease, partial [Vicinamibacterales bacterium]|nr:ABC transporter permease [Vicinamibacterales bacterium]
YGDVVQVIQTEGVHAALGVPLLQGRFFTRDDRMRGLPVVIVNRQFVSRFLGERQNPIGRTISYGGQPHTIVGVVGDTQELSVRQELKPVAYFPFRTEQWQPARVFLVARLSSGGVQEWVSRVQSLVPGIAVEAHPLTIRWTREAAPIRFAALSLSGIGLVSLILLAVGVSAVVVKTVADQQRRLAVQMALGAPIPLIQRQVTSSLFWPVAVGMAAGLLLARAVSPLFDSLVFETSVFDMSIWVVALVVVTASAAVPAWTVSRRVFLLDPATILRES